jgi:excisionase family DNA binding protein
MGMRRYNPRLAKIHRSYTVEEVAKLYSVHKNTVRSWVKQGLLTSDNRKPMLILGRDLKEFLQVRRTRNKRPCQSGEIYCVRCREPKSPAGDMVDYQPLTPTLGTLVGICPSCDAIIYRRTGFAKLGQIRGQLDITIPEAQ